MYYAFGKFLAISCEMVCLAANKMNVPINWIAEFSTESPTSFSIRLKDVIFVDPIESVSDWRNK